MKMNKIYNFLFLLAALIGSPQISASEAEFIKLKKDYILHEDGSQEFRCYKELKIFTYTAMRSTYGETFIVYNPGFQELKIHSCYTKQKDGTIIKTPGNAFVEVLPRFAADAPAYNRLKEMVVVHTGLDLGSTIYLDYSILTKAGYYPALDMDEFIQELSPVQEYQYSISVPGNVHLNKQLYASAVKEAEQTASGQKTYSWSFKNLPASARETNLPENKENVPRLTANTYAGRTQAILALADKIDKQVALESETYAQFITEDCPSDKEKLSLIHNYVVRNISTIPIPLAYTGYSLRNADETLRSAYGTEIEKVNLLNKMLNAAGIVSEVVLYYPSTTQDAGGLASVKRIGVKIVSDGEEKHLSATKTEMLNPEFRGDLDKPVTLAGKELSISRKPAVNDEVKELTVDSKAAKNGYLVYTLPPGKGFDSWHITNLNSKRENVFEVPSAIREKITYMITLPQGTELLSSANPYSLETPAGKISRTIRKAGDKLEIVRTIELNKLQYTVSEYAGIKKLITEWNSDKNKQLLFKVNQ